jgi:hypothetical protein
MQIWNDRSDNHYLDNFVLTARCGRVRQLRSDGSIYGGGDRGGSTAAETRLVLRERPVLSYVRRILVRIVANLAHEQGYAVGVVERPAGPRGQPGALEAQITAGV